MRHFTMLAAVLFTVTLFAGEGGTLKGSVKVEGDIPPLPVFVVEPVKAAGCKCKDAPNQLAVDAATKGIKWAVVRIMGVKAPDPAAPFVMPVIDQANCVYEPRAVIVPVGGTVDFLNPEGIMHAIGLTPLDGDLEPTNVVMAPNVPRMTIKKKVCFAGEGVQMLSCAPHGWMKGLIVVHDPRFAAVTTTDGSFEIKDVPPGKYTVNITHETFEKAMEVEIKPGAVTPLEVKHTIKK